MEVEQEEGALYLRETEEAPQLGDWAGWTERILLLEIIIETSAFSEPEYLAFDKNLHAYKPLWDGMR